MSKSTTGRKARKKTRRAPTVRMRARAILEDDRYDEDTRNAIASALKQNRATDLNDFVTRAEQGEIICDAIAEQEKYEQAAALVVQAINESKTPDWLTNEMFAALGEAAQINKVPIYGKDGMGDIDVKELANLFVLTQRLEPRVAPTARQRVANALSELLCNEDSERTDSNARASGAPVARIARSARRNGRRSRTASDLAATAARIISMRTSKRI